MFNKMKYYMVSGLATFVVFVAALSIKPACVLFLHQPNVPEHLRDR